MKEKNFRLTKLIRPRLQLRLSAAFVALCSFALLFQLLLVAYVFTSVANELGDAGSALLEEMPSALFKVLGVTLLVCLPIATVVGVLTTFKIAGPIHRFTLHLRQVRDGETSEACNLRSDDQLQEFCELLNEVTEPLRDSNRDARRLENDAAA